MGYNLNPEETRHNSDESGTSWTPKGIDIAQIWKL